MKHLVIIGFMGSGKSAFSSVLAHRFSMPLISTDQIIEEQVRMPISEIFKTFGEEFFRLQESQVFRKVSQLRDPHIIDCGGGFGINQEVQELGRVIFLDLEFDEIVQRMNEEERKKRPLFSSFSKAKELFIQRRQIYEKKSTIILKRIDKNSLLQIQELLK